MAVRIKICGVTRAEDAEVAVSLGADFVGLNFYPKSPRFVTLECAHEIRRAVGGRSRLVGVFVNAAREYVEERRAELDLDLLQFHGDEDESDISGWPVAVIRALRLRPGEPLDAISRTGADYILLDTFDTEVYGGSGRARPLEDLKGADLARVFISGGLCPDSVALAAALGPYAVDVASGVESAPGVKDHAKLRSFIANAKSSR